MMMLIVGPLIVFTTPLSCVSDGVEFAGVIGLILQGLEGTFADRVVIAHAWSAVAAGDIQCTHGTKITVGRHR